MLSLGRFPRWEDVLRRQRRSPTAPLAARKGLCHHHLPTETTMKYIVGLTPTPESAGEAVGRTSCARVGALPSQDAASLRTSTDSSNPIYPLGVEFDFGRSYAVLLQACHSARGKERKRKNVPETRVATLVDETSKAQSARKKGPA